MNDSSGNDLQSEIFAIIAKQAKIDPATITPQSTLKDLGIASLDAIEMIFDIEEHFDITFPEQQGADFGNDTMKELMDAVRQAQAEKGPSA